MLSRMKENRPTALIQCSCGRQARQLFTKAFCTEWRRRRRRRGLCHVTDWGQLSPAGWAAGTLPSLHKYPLGSTHRVPLMSLHQINPGPVVLEQPSAWFYGLRGVWAACCSRSASPPPIVNRCGGVVAAVSKELGIGSRSPQSSLSARTAARRRLDSSEHSLCYVPQRYFFTGIRSCTQKQEHALLREKKKKSPWLVSLTLWATPTPACLPRGTGGDNGDPQVRPNCSQSDPKAESKIEGNNHKLVLQIGRGLPSRLAVTPASGAALF